VTRAAATRQLAAPRVRSVARTRAGRLRGPWRFACPLQRNARRCHRTHTCHPQWGAPQSLRQKRQRCQFALHHARTGRLPGARDIEREWASRGVVAWHRNAIWRPARWVSPKRLPVQVTAGGFH